MRRPFVALPLEKHKVLRILDGKRSEYDGIDEAEDGGVSADAERERDNRDGREPWVLGQLTQRQTKIIHNEARP